MHTPSVQLVAGGLLRPLQSVLVAEGVEVGRIREYFVVASRRRERRVLADAQLAEKSLTISLAGPADSGVRRLGLASYEMRGASGELVAQTDIRSGLRPFGVQVALHVGPRKWTVTQTRPWQRTAVLLDFRASPVADIRLGRKPAVRLMQQDAAFEIPASPAVALLLWTLSRIR